MPLFWFFWQQGNQDFPGLNSGARRVGGCPCQGLGGKWWRVLTESICNHNQLSCLWSIQNPKFRDSQWCSKALGKTPPLGDILDNKNIIIRYSQLWWYCGLYLIAFDLTYYSYQPFSWSPVTTENRNETVVTDQSTVTVLEPRAPSIQMHLRPCATSIISRSEASSGEAGPVKQWLDPPLLPLNGRLYPASYPVKCKGEIDSKSKGDFWTT